MIKDLMYFCAAEYMDTNYRYAKDGNTWILELYADYRDELDNRTIAKLLDSATPIDALYEYLYEAYCEANMDLRDDISMKIRTAIENKYGELIEDDLQAMEDWIDEHIIIQEPIKHFLKQEVHVNVTVDTGDGNYDYVLNAVYPHYAGRYNDTINNKASIVWLAKQQGYKKGELTKALLKGDMTDPKGFLESMRVELANAPSQCLTLTFLVRMTVEQLFQLNEVIAHREEHCYDATKRANCGYITLGKETETGLYDPWDGGGSLFEVHLERDVNLPIRFIRQAYPDVSKAGMDRYSVGETYGMCASAWRDTLKGIHAFKKK